MQLIVSLSVFISACGPFSYNARYDLVTVSLLYLLEKVCRPKCQMIKEQSAVLFTSHLSVHLISIQAPICYNATPLSFWAYVSFFFFLLPCCSIQDSTKPAQMQIKHIVDSVTSIGKLHKQQQFLAQLLRRWFFRCFRDNAAQNVTGKSLTSQCALIAVLLHKTKGQLKQT